MLAMLPMATEMAPPIPSPPLAPDAAGTTLGQVVREGRVRDGRGRAVRIIEAAAEAVARGDATAPDGTDAYCRPACNW